MKALKKTLATFIAVCLLGLSALAFDGQKNDPKPPPKNPNEIKPQEKPPPPPPPKNDNKGKGGKP